MTNVYWLIVQLRHNLGVATENARSPLSLHRDFERFKSNLSVDLRKQDGTDGCAIQTGRLE